MGAVPKSQLLHSTHSPHHSVGRLQTAKTELARSSRLARLMGNQMLASSPPQLRMLAALRRAADRLSHQNSKRARKRLATAVSALQQLNLVAFTSTTLWIATDLDDLLDLELRELAVEMLSHIGHTNLARGLRMPRRMLVSLMTSKRPRPVYAGVMFALLICTMLTKRYETCKGCCKASWIALVFGGDPSSIKSARSRLIEDGWFTRLETPQRVRQRYLLRTRPRQPFGSHQGLVL